ncbi:hypothetical protein Pint_36737 [Pistacia integerrima]|nr:hypothetical protein Pint_36737 [Pistacia integerrima]
MLRLMIGARPCPALPFADALKLLSYLKDWASNPDKVILFALWNI